MIPIGQLVRHVAGDTMLGRVIRRTKNGYRVQWERDQSTHPERELIVVHYALVGRPQMGPR